MHDHVNHGRAHPAGSLRGRRPWRRTRLVTGIVLPVAMALLFVMLTLALGLAEQGRALLGFTVQNESEALEIEANELEFADMQAILQGELPTSTLGLPAAIPTPSGAAATFQQPAGGPLEVLGQFNGLSSNVSTYSVKPVDQIYDGYSSGTLAGGMYAPSRHVVVVSTARYPNMPSTTHASVFTSNHPYGILAPNGTITVNGDARSSINCRGNDTDESGVMVHLAARSGVTVTGFVNGRVQVQSGTMTLGSGGIRSTVATGVGIPTDFTASLATARTQITTGLTSIGPLIDALHAALHRSFPPNWLITGSPPPGATPISQYNTGSLDINTINAPAGTDLNGSTFKCGVDFVIPASQGIVVPYSCDFASNLALMGRSVLHVQGDLRVGGNLYLSDMSSLVVDGKLTVTGRLDMANVNALVPANQVVVLASSDVSLPNGMQRTPGVMPVPTVPFSARSNPFAGSWLSWVIPGDPPTPGTSPVTNPNNILFNTQALTDLAAVSGLVPFFMNVTPAGAVATDDVPGALVSAGGTLTAGGTKFAGLGVASSQITVTSTRTVGALWSRDAGVIVGDYRYHPYFTHAYGHSLGTDIVPVTSTRYHRTAYGKVFQ